MKYKRDIQPQYIEEGFAIAAIFQMNCPPVVECTLWLASKHLGRDSVDFFIIMASTEFTIARVCGCIATVNSGESSTSAWLKSEIFV